MFENQANIESTNIFETMVGALNIAPIKISGQYKIVIDVNNQLWLDDYTGRRVKVNLSKPFLPQVSIFLQTKTSIVDTKYLRYGGFQRSTTKSIHIPIYLGSTNLPKYFVLSRIINETITNINYVYKFGNILSVIDLDKIFLTPIFNEILSESYFNYPLYFNWNDKNLNLYGFSIDKLSPIVISIDLLQSMANQTYLQNLNNKILNSYQNNNIFFPRFINLEFEFEYSNEYVHFNNFYGFLSNNNIVSNVAENALTVKLQDYSNNIEWEQVTYNNSYNLLNYESLIADGSLQEINEQLSQYRFKVNRLEIDDSIKIYHPNGIDLDFEYNITESDINATSLYNTLLNVGKQINKLSNKSYSLKVENLNIYCNVTLISNSGILYDEEYIVQLPSYYTILDRYIGNTNYNNFRKITKNDVWLSGQPNLLDNVNEISINNVIYTIIDKFLFNNNAIIRLNKFPNINGLTNCKIYESKTETLLQLSPINFFNINSNLVSTLPYDFNEYCNELHTLFDSSNPAVSTIIEDFRQFCKISVNQYVIDGTSQLEDTNTLDITDYNTELVKNMLFSSMGQTTYLTPNILNFDKNFYTQNGNIDLNQANADVLKYNWFLIKGICPQYLLNDIRKLRYFDNVPQITSRLIKLNNDFCETLFLGVKYQLPIEYENYQFAVYLNFNNKLDDSLNYKFEIDNKNKLVLLSLNEYLDFSDLLRGSLESNTPLLDLSFFHNVSKAYNDNSDFLYAFNSGGIKLAPKLQPGEYILFGNTPIYDWKYFYQNKWYIALTRESGLFQGNPNNFTYLFPEAGDITVYVYSNIEYENVNYIYISTSIKIKNILHCEDDYLWCEDMEIKFFDTPTIFVNKFNDTTQEFDISQLNLSEIINFQDINNNTFGDYEQISTIVVNGNNETFNLLLPNKILSFKEYYFEINQISSEDAVGNLTFTKNVFKFPEFFIPSISDNDLIEKFDPNYLINDETTNSKITLFNRNQVWKFIQDILLVDLKFKYLSKNQILQLLNNYMVQPLKDYTENNSIPIVNPLIAPTALSYTLTSGSNLSIGQYYYVVTFLTLNGESDASPILIVNTTTNNTNVILTIPISNDETVIGRKIYRSKLGDNSNKYYITTIINNTTTNYTDDTADIYLSNIIYKDNIINYLKINVIDNERNICIWNILGQNKITLLSRYKISYLPYLPLAKNEIDFQLPNNKVNNTLFNIYDKDFGGSGISATGLWQEVDGNLISSLYCKTSNIEINIDYQKDIDYIPIIINWLDINQTIIVNNNSDYISKIDANVDKYILKTYTNFLLMNFFTLNCIKNELGQKLQYSIDANNPTLVHLKDICKQLTFIFVRK